MGADRHKSAEKFNSKGRIMSQKKQEGMERFVN